MNNLAASSDSASETQFLPTDSEYRKTGILPVEKTDDEILAEQERESAPATEKHVETEESAPSTAAAVESAPTQLQRKNKETTARRFQELLTEIKTLKEQIGKAPAQAQQTAPPPVTEAKKPQMSEYKTMGEYLSAVETWNETATDKKIQSVLAERQTQWQREQEAKGRADNWQSKVTPAQKKYADFDAIALNPDLPIDPKSVTFAFLHDSDHGADVLYHLGSNPDKLAEINAMPPLKAARALYAIESEVSKPASAPAVTKAPPPPHQVSGKGTTTGSAVEKAIAEGDFEAYRKAENAKALARLKRK